MGYKWDLSSGACTLMHLTHEQTIQEATSESDINNSERRHQDENFCVKLCPIKISMVFTGMLQVK